VEEKARRVERPFVTNWPRSLLQKLKSTKLIILLKENKMKTFFMGCLTLLAVLAISPGLNAEAYVVDNISLFLQESIDGELTGKYYHLKIEIYRGNGETGWSASHEEFREDNDEKCVFVEMEMSDSNQAKHDHAAFLKNIKWEAGKKLKCTYRAYGGECVELEAKKVPHTENEWNATGKGLFHYTDYSEKLDWELKSVKNITLKYPKMMLYGAYK
jgi:hypothetical protein